MALIRLRDGSPLMDASGRVTSHLSGLFFRTTRLLAEYSPKLAFVFDGAPPVEKATELDRRREVKARYEKERADAVARGDFAAAYSKATMTSRLSREMVGEARELLRLLGLPVIQAPSEGHGRIEDMPAEIRDAVGEVDPLRRIYRQPKVTDEYHVEFTEPDVDGVVKFLCDERQFSRERVTTALERAFPPPRLF